MKKYYFMAGLPRSGSTLLSAILNQNPNIYSGHSSPVVSTMLVLEQHLNNDELFRAYPKPREAGFIISNVINQFYADVTKPIIIDKNRSWTNRPHYIEGYFGIEPKIICPVRNIDEILASFISMHRRNPIAVNGKINFIDDMLVKNNLPLTDEMRCVFLAGSNGILGQSYSAIKDLLVAGKHKMLHFVEYDDLANRPKETMDKLYDFLGESRFDHDFNNIENIHKENDAHIYGFADMHDVRRETSKKSIDPNDILPPSIIEKCKGLEIWRNLQPINFEIDQSSDNRLIGD